VILLDTSALVDCFTGAKKSGTALHRAVDRGEWLQLPAPVLYEWLRGPRLPEELSYQEALFPIDATLPFGPAEAARAAELYRTLPRARGREMDLAIAATALTWDARLWTLNVEDFKDVPGLVVERPQ
jgi:predicted nucleic acid-binding protein